MRPEVITRGFGFVEDQLITEFTIRFEGKLETKIINYGGIISSIRVPDKNGNLGEVTIGFDRLEEYLHDPFYMGAIIGRTSGRISNGRLPIGKQLYRLPCNLGAHHLHGGVKGFNAKVWKVKMHVIKSNSAEILLEYHSQDQEEGYPGNLTTQLKFEVFENEITIQYECESDKTTYVNLTHHPYFNLSNQEGDILAHDVQINSDKYIPVTDGLIPTGTIKNVGGSPFDFRKCIKISELLESDNEQVQLGGGGYDHTWVLNPSGDHPSAIVTSRDSGRTLKIYTDKPCVQFYTGNHLGGKGKGREEKLIDKFSALCLEPQNYPDAVNKPNFPLDYLKPNELHHSFIAYKFGLLAK